jgi:hypothetical protein
MPPDRTEVLSRISFKLGRRHSWANHVLVGDFFNDVLTDQELKVTRNDVLPDIRRGNVEWIGYKSNGDEWIWIRGDKHDEVARFLDRNSGYSRLQIEATFSRFGGF